MHAGTLSVRGISRYCIFALALLLAACGGGGGDSAPPPTYTIGVTVNGLAGTGLVLQNNLGNNLAITGNGAFVFSTSLASGATYSVSVFTKPTNPGQGCTVTNGSGAVGSANVTNVNVLCVTSTSTIGGTVFGLSGAGLVLQNNSGDNLAVSASGTFIFSTPVAIGTPYSVTVLTQPSNPAQTCTVTNGSGTAPIADVTTVTITCLTNTYTIGGIVSGFAGGTPVVLRNNGGDQLVISANGLFIFGATVASGAPYAVTVFTQPTNPSQSCTVVGGSGTVVSANITNVSVVCATIPFTIGGTVSGLTGTGLVLRNNAGDNLPVAANATTFTFSTPILSGATYAVTVLTPPNTPTQTCVVTSGSGTVGAANVTSVSVSCTTNSYTIGGTVSGLSGTGLVLRNNGGDSKTISANGVFTFTTPVLSGAPYAVTVFAQPATPTQTCTVTTGSGTVGGANVTTVAVACSTNTYTIGGAITGLTGTGLVLRNNAGNDLTVAANATTFTFSTSIASGAAYAVTVFTQPNTPTQTCTITSGSGTVVSANVASVSISCATNTYTIGGTISGLTGTGLVLQNNAGNNLTVAASATTFTFGTPILSGAPYAVTVLTPPNTPTQTCTVTTGSGTVGGANVITVAIACATNTYTIGGTISGLSGAGTGLVLQNNAGNNLTVAAGATAFTFGTPILSGATYAVTVLTQPSTPTQTCTVATGSGTVGGANVTTVAITCSTNTFTIGGSVTLLAGAGLKLTNNGGDEITIAKTGPFTFTFPTPVASGAAYVVAVSAQPTGLSQTCAVTSGSGTVTTANVTNVSISCVTNTFTIGGTVSGYTTFGGGGFTLRLNGNSSNNLILNANGAFTFTGAPLLDGLPYSVTVFVQPLQQTCTVSPNNGNGTLAGANVTNIAVTCATTTYAVGGTITGLTGTGLVLRNSYDLGINTENFTVAANATSFAFPTQVAFNSDYSVSVFTQPNTPTQTCTVTSGSGTVSGTVASVSINCTTNTYTIGGTISGLSGAGTGLVLRNNGGNNLTVAAGATTFTFSAPIASGALYAVTVLTQPSTPTQNCLVSSGSGTVGGANVASVSISCTTTNFTIGGTISGLSGTGLVLHNGSENLTVAANATTFTFLTSVASGGGYAVTASAQPSTPTQTCAVTSGSGTVGAANVISVSIACTTTTYTIGGTISGLSGTGLVLRNNGGDNLTVPANATTFTFATSIASGAAYAVTVLTPPNTPTQSCTVTGGTGAGTVVSSNVASVTISCATNSYTIGGTVTGLAGTGLKLKNNGGDEITIAKTGPFTFTFATPVASGAGYNVTVSAQPTVLSQNCTVTGPTGTVGGANVSVTVTCVTPGPRFAYVANFADNSVSIYTVNAVTGQLRLKGYVPAGTHPLMVSIDPTGQFAYVPNLDSSNISAYTINSGTGALTEIFGSPFTARANPWSVSIDPAGKFAYVANDGDASVSVYTIDSGTGALLSPPGVRVAAGSNPHSVTIDPSGKFAYVANHGSNTVSAYTINSGTGALTEITSGSPFAAGVAPRSVTVDPSGKFAFVANDGNPASISAYAITPVTGALTPAPGSPLLAVDPLSHPLWVTVDPTGKFAYTANQGTDDVSAFSINPANGALTLVGTVAAGGVASSPVAVTVDPTGTFAYVSNTGSHNISIYTIDAGTGALTLLSKVTGRNGNEGMAMTKGAAVAYTPKFAYVANSGGDVSGFTINAASGALTSVGAAVGAGTTPDSVSVDPSGRFAYVANAGGTVSAYAIDSGTGVLSPVGPVAAGTTPASVSVDLSGRYAYVANAGSANVSAYTIGGGGALTEVTLGSPFPAGTGPASVTVDPSGKFAYVANAAGTVSAYTIASGTGVLTAVTGSPFAAGTTPQSVAVDPSGRFAYVANAGGTVSTYAIDTRDAGISGAFPGALTTPGSVAAGTNPVSVTVHPSGQFAYVVNNSGVQRFTINATSGALTAVGSAVAAGTTPVSISVDASGKFAYVANAGGGVTRFTIDAGTGALTGPVTTAAGTGPSSVTTTGTSQ